ncbi:MarR family transcriptional regulator [Parapedobacter lycopersici]|uniref:MarR family winged helix-turn-helix transcriptional regulator n=1 Tax=Parapedobacter lycopersici TaxID=1864939 RepID=UPI00334131E8
MKIEEEIKTDKFVNEQHRATVNIVFTSNWISHVLEERAGEEQITLQQFNVLRILRGRHPEPATNNLLKERMIDKMPDISRIIDRLVVKGLVSRGRCNTDRRAVDVRITSEGLAVLDRLDERMLMMDMLHRMTDEECRQLNDLLDKMREAAVR